MVFKYEDYIDNPQMLNMKSLLFENSLGLSFRPCLTSTYMCHIITSRTRRYFQILMIYYLKIILYDLKPPQLHKLKFK